MKILKFIMNLLGLSQIRKPKNVSKNSVVALFENAGYTLSLTPKAKSHKLFSSCYVLKEGKIIGTLYYFNDNYKLFLAVKYINGEKKRIKPQSYFHALNWFQEK